MTQIVYLRDKNARDLVLTADGHIQVDVLSLSGLSVDITKDEISGLNVLLIPASRDNLSGLNIKLTRDDLSGLNVKEFGDTVRTGSTVTIEGLSGGTALGSGATFKVVVRSQSGNTIMFLGGTGSNAPFDGKGLELYGGESITLPVDNFNKVRIFASTSGQKISFLGVA